MVAYVNKKSYYTCTLECYDNTDFFYHQEMTHTYF